MATIDKKQTRWYSKSTFDSLDKTTIPVGTEIQVGGEIEEADLTADLQTKINGKLTAPTTPTADSAVTLLADGTVGTKALSEFGGKLYRHVVEIKYNTGLISLFAIFYTSNSTSINTVAKIADIGQYINCAYNGYNGAGSVMMTPVANTGTIEVYGLITNRNADTTINVHEVNATPTEITDTVTEV